METNLNSAGQQIQPQRKEIPLSDPKTARARVLAEANKIVHHDRNNSYGNPEDNFKQAANLWSAYKKVPFTSHDVAIMSLLIKVARLSTSPNHHDSAVDIAGYAACLGDIQESTLQQYVGAASMASNSGREAC